MPHFMKLTAKDIWEKEKKSKSYMYDTPAWITLKKIQDHGIQPKLGIKHKIGKLILSRGLTTPPRPHMKADICI